MKLVPFPASLAWVLCLWISVAQGASPQMPEWVKREAAPAKVRKAPVSPTAGIRPSAEVRLEAPDLREVFAEDAAARANSGQSKGPARVGIRRPLGAGLAVAGSKAPWTSLASGERVWTGRIQSEGAHGLRVRFEEVSLPTGAEILVYDTLNPERFEGPFDLEYLAGRGGFWSPSVFSSDVTVECRVPAGAASAAFRITEVTHRYVALGSEGKSDEAKAAGACNINLACETAWVETSKAVAGIGSVGASGEIFCTGCLLNDSNPAAGTDYFLTAEHCLTGQSEADTTEFYWNYQAATCTAVPPNPATVPRTTGGAVILSARSLESLNDHCFLRLRGTVPAGVTYAGWTSDPPTAGEVITGIHHPDGDYKRISFGTATALNANYWRIAWTRGVTEPGSSGSPIFNAQRQVIGQLYGGSSSCSNTDPALQNDQYGRFNITFPLIRRWLLNEAVNPPANDNLAAATVLTGTSGTSAEVNTQDAGSETGEPNHGSFGGRNSVWYRWTAPATTNVTFEVVGNNFDSVLAVYTGTNIASLKLVIANNDGDLGATASRVGFAVVAGREYLLVVDGSAGEYGTFRLSWRPGGEITRPPNNNFADAAQVVGFGGIYHSSNLGFSRETGEPVHAGTAGARSAWWVWTAPITATVNVNTINSSFDTLLAVYRGNSVSALTTVAFNDDISAANQIYQSSVDFSAVAGQTYRIAVDGYVDSFGQEEGEIRLEVSQGGGTPGPNNAFASAVAISGATGSATGNNVNFSREAGEPSHAGIAGQRSAWWRWTAPATGVYVFETVGSAFDTVLAVYTGSAVNGLTEVVSNDDILLGDVWQSRVSFNATQGQVYRIAVDGFFETGTTQEQGNIRLAWRQSSTLVEQGDLMPVAGSVAPRVESRTFLASDCEVAAGCGVVGARRLLLADLEIRNIGTVPIALGSPSVANGFVTNACRTGWEWPGFVTLRLLSTNGASILSREVSMCVSDNLRWNTSAGPATAQFNCDAQGLSAGWAATSTAGAACRWLDVTDVAAGSYLLEVVVDAAGRITEASETNNVVRIPVVIEAPVTVPNDAFATPFLLSGNSGATNGTTVGATLESGEPTATGRSTVWFSWTATCDGTVVFDTLGSAFDTYISAYSGSTLGGLTLVAENDDIGEVTQSEIRILASVGQDFRIRVDGYDPSASGPYTLNWRVENPTACGGSITISGAAMTAGGLEVSFTAVNGTRYALQSTENLGVLPVVWTQVTTATGTGAVIRLVDPASAPGQRPSRFYRIVTVP